MSREHKPLQLYRTPLWHEWEAVKVGQDGETITDKYPLTNIRDMLTYELTAAEPIAAAERAMRGTLEDLAGVSKETLSDALRTAIAEAVKAVTPGV
ncbi:hypothetical protein [uncultured Bifidobacterium sp.]|uniref:hypothetical protein n=1 Tax=uncultured Bifidobacterium sp. TaxID=165187 RepID=UPI0025981BE2|nr:hypothetical protein [uncultured Bifidobacterium sp.]